MRAALYARFSDPKQNPRSVADQLALCAAHAARRGWSVVASFQDAAISGGAMANRPGLLAALAAAQAQTFDILLVEAEDRISRNLGQLATLREDLQAAGVTLATLHTDDVGLMQVAMTGLIAQQYIIDLGRKTARGMASNADKGLATGSRLYGYRSEPGGALSIVEEEAEVIRRIFRLYTQDALVGREIAARLNAEAVPGPRGGLWNASSVNGSRQRGNGVLNTDLYAGTKTYGRMKVTKDPRTGKRRPAPIPPAQWTRVPVPHLAIIDPATWTQAQAIRAARAGESPLTHARARKPGIFTGLLKCGHCGASYTVYRRGMLICAGHRERGPAACPNGHEVNRAELESRILHGLQTRLLDPAVVGHYVRLYHQAYAEEAARAARETAPLEKRRALLARQVERLVDAICDGSATPAMKLRLNALEAEKAGLEDQLQALDAAFGGRPAVTLHPKAADAYVAQVTRLQAHLAEITADPERAANHRPLIDTVRGLAQRIDITPDLQWAKDPRAPKAKNPVRLTLHGELSLLLSRSPDLGSSGFPSPEWRRRVVAGGRYTITPPAIPISFPLRA